MNYSDIIDKKPLLLFSVCTASQVDRVNEMGSKTLDKLERCFIGKHTIDSNEYRSVCDTFWFWTLGAYEIVRTMIQAKSCLSPSLVDQLIIIKKRLSKLRMPFAKQEIAGNSQKPAIHEPFVYGIDEERKDLLYHIDNKGVSMRQIIVDFKSLFISIRPEDIIKGHRYSDKYKQEIKKG